MKNLILKAVIFLFTVGCIKKEVLPSNEMEEYASQGNSTASFETKLPDGTNLIETFKDCNYYEILNMIDNNFSKIYRNSTIEYYTIERNSPIAKDKNLKIKVYLERDTVLNTLKLTDLFFYLKVVKNNKIYTQSGGYHDDVKYKTDIKLSENKGLINLTFETDSLEKGSPNNNTIPVLYGKVRLNMESIAVPRVGY